MHRLALIVVAGCGGAIRETDTAAHDTPRVHLAGGEDRIRVVTLDRLPDGTAEQPHAIDVKVVWEAPTTDAMWMRGERGRDRAQFGLLGGATIEVERDGMRVRTAAVVGRGGALVRVPIPKVWDDALATWTRMSTVVGTHELCWLGGFYSTTGAGRSFDGVPLDGGLCFGDDGRWRATRGDVVNFNLFGGADWYSCFQQVNSAQQAMFRCELHGEPKRYVQVQGLH